VKHDHVRWLVVFEGEQRLVYARTAEGARKTAEYAQRITKAPKTARRALSVQRVDPRTNQPITE
jgi:hypothetical protein